MRICVKHPFPILAHFDYSIVVTFAAKAYALKCLLPAPFQLDRFQEDWAFIALAAVKTRALRPAGFPGFLGRNFFLTGYRIFTRFENESGRRRRGLYILKSEADSFMMKIMGNFLTNYRYDYVPTESQVTDTDIEISSPSLSLSVSRESAAKLPDNSPFRDWKEARRFAGPLPFTFSTWKDKTLIVEGVRSNWEPTPVRVNHIDSAYIKNLPVELQLASAFLVENVDYSWKSGILE